jgi:hypothetical protein
MEREMLQGFTILSNAASAIVVVLRKGQPSADGWQRAWGYYYSRTLFKIYFYQGICKKGGRTFIFAKIKPTL